MMLYRYMNNDSFYDESTNKVSIGDKTLVSILAKRDLRFTQIDKNFSVSDLEFEAYHYKHDRERYREYLKKFNVTDDPGTILVERDSPSDTYLLIANTLPGTMFSLQAEFRFDIYAGWYKKVDSYAFLLKINNSFKFQEYYYDGTTAYVTDRIFKFNHIKSSLSYSEKVSKFDKPFYLKNKDLFDGTGARNKYPHWEYFWIRDSKDYPR